MSKKLLAANATWSLISHVFSRGSLMLAAVILARHFEVDEFAAYSYYQLTISMLAAYASMGLGVTASKFFATVGHEKQNEAPKPLGILWVLSICFALIASVCVLFIPNDWLNAGLTVPKWLLAVGVLTLVLQVVPGGAILGLEKYKYATAVSIVSGIIILLGAFLAIKQDAVVIGMLAIVISSIFQSIGESTIVIMSVGFKNIFKFNCGYLIGVKIVLSFAGPMLFVSILAASGAWALGQLIIRESGSYSFSLYSMGMMWYSLSLVVPGMISRVILPSVVRIEFSNQKEKKALIKSASLLATCIAGLIFVFGTILSPYLIKIYGVQYSENRWLIGGYLAAAMLIAPANTLGNAIVANNGQNVWLSLTIIWFVLLLLIGYICISWGAWSGAIAQGISAALLTALAFFAARSKNLV